MAYEFIDRAKEALAANNLPQAVSEMFGPFEIEKITKNVDSGDVAALRDWARSEQDGGYGIRAEILDRVADTICPPDQRIYG